MSFKYTGDFPMLLKRAGKLLRVLYLIERSDIPAVSIPTVRFCMDDKLSTLIREQVVVALAISGVPSVPLFIKGVVWCQLHLLAFEVCARSSCSALKHIILICE